MVYQRNVVLAGSAHLELVSGVVQLRPEDAMFDAMLRGWRAQQKSRGLRDETIDPRERLVRRFLEFANEYPWQRTPAHLDEWSASLTSEKHLAPSTIRSYQGTVRLFAELLIDARYGWGPACEEAFGAFPEGPAPAAAERAVGDGLGRRGGRGLRRERPATLRVPRPPGSMDHRTRRTPPARLHQRPVRGIP